ncbi:hypothetical protein ACJ41O_000842 [Fusarium nematophilum]
MSDNEDYSHEAPTLSLCGNSYFFSGPVRSYGRVPNTIGGNNRLDFNHKNGSSITEYVVLGPKEHYFRCNNSNLEDYPDLTSFLADRDVERPLFLSLGPSGFYYIRSEDGSSASRFPLGRLIQAWREKAFGENIPPIQRLWFGAGGTWVVEYTSRVFDFDLKGMYGDLENELRSARELGTQIAALTMNLTDGKSYACVFEDGDVAYEVGEPAVFDGGEFERWCEENFEFKKED